METEVCFSSEPKTELGVATSATAPSLLDRLRCPAQSQEKERLRSLLQVSASKMLYHASTMLNALGFYNDQNYAGIICQGLATILLVGNYMLFRAIIAEMAKLHSASPRAIT